MIARSGRLVLSFELEVVETYTVCGGQHGRNLFMQFMGEWDHEYTAQDADVSCTTMLPYFELVYEVEPFVLLAVLCAEQG